MLTVLLVEPLAQGLQGQARAWPDPPRAVPGPEPGPGEARAKREAGRQGMATALDRVRVTPGYERALAAVLGRDGKLVIRPDSGDPVDILCGTDPLAVGGDASPEENGVPGESRNPEKS